MGVITDPIADMLTRIRNANTANHQTVDIPASKMKKAVAQILLDEGFITTIETVEQQPQSILRLTLKYGPEKEKVITASAVPVCASTPRRRKSRAFWAASVL